MKLSLKVEGGEAHVEGALALALGAAVGLDLGFASVLEERPQHIAAAPAVKLDLLQLREHVGAPRHHTSRADQLIQVHLPANQNRHFFRHHHFHTMRTRP